MNDPFHILWQALRRAGFMVLLLLCGFFSALAQREPWASDTVSLRDSSSATRSIGNSNGVSNDSSHAEESSAEEDSAQLRSVPDSVLSGFRSDKDFAYANDPSYWVREPIKQEKNFLNNLFERLSSRSFRTIIYVLIASILVFALYKIVIENKMFIFYSPPAPAEAESKLDLDMDPVDLEEKIRQAILDNNLPAATRWMYLKTLRMLSNAGFIQLHIQSTNQDFIQQMQNRPMADDFNFLSRVIEQVCYGGFALSSEQFHLIRNRFEKFYIQMDPLK